MNVNLINHIAATIRRVDGGHTMGAAALAEAIVNDLPAADSQTAIAVAVDALIGEGWSRDDLAAIARTVLRTQQES